LTHDVEPSDPRTVENVYIMSPIRPYRGENIWSPLSRRKIKQVLQTKLCLQERQDNDILKREYKHKNNNDNDDNQLTYPHLFYFDILGREQTAKAQCEIFLSDIDANVVTLHDICQHLQCETPHKNEFYIAGRALNGTFIYIRLDTIILHFPILFQELIVHWGKNAILGSVCPLSNRHIFLNIVKRITGVNGEKTPVKAVACRNLKA